MIIISRKIDIVYAALCTEYTHTVLIDLKKGAVHGTVTKSQNL